MELQLGERIARLRKEKGMTQEQLASALGISSPAVSKWETDSSYPDITLLCSLARALGTNVDYLLAYEERLSKEKITQYVNEMIAVKREQGVEKAEEKLQKLLHQYPNSIPLKFNAAALLTTFEVQNSKVSEEDKQRWKQQKKELLMAVYESGDAAYRQPAISALASLELQDGHLDEAERLLEQLPETPSDATALWANLYLKRGQSEKVIQILQRKMFTLANQMASCLVMMIEQSCEDEQRLLPLCGIYQKLDEIIYAGKGESDIILAEVHGKLGHEKEAADYLLAYLESHAKKLPLPNPILFAPTIKFAYCGKEPSAEMREMLLRGIRSDETLSKLCEREDVKALFEKWEGK